MAVELPLKVEEVLNKFVDDFRQSDIKYRIEHDYGLLPDTEYDKLREELRMATIKIRKRHGMDK
jgi:hypothetical protein